MVKPKLIRITTVPESLFFLLNGQLNFMSKYFDVKAISSDGPLRMAVKEREGVETIAVNMTRKITPLQDLKSVWNLYKIFKKEKPLIVHTHTPKAGIVGMIAAKLACVPNRFHTIGGLPLIIERGFKYYILYCVEKLTFKFSTKLFPVSYGIRDFIIDKKLAKPNKLTVILNGSSNGLDTSHYKVDQCVEAEKSKLRENLNINISDFVFVFVGRMVADKGINELINAFTNLLKERDNLKLLLVGPFEDHLDPLNNETMRVIKNNSNIISVGFQKDVRPYFVISNALVFPSYREGFGNVIAQAGSMELPCIVTNITGCNEIIENGKNGLIIPSQDEHALKNAMIRFLDDTKLVNELKNNSRKMILDRYDQNKFWNALLLQYNLCV